ncbi:hypothetical protein ACFV6D_09995 [Kitasatospora sp. NPDC059812]|uniref:hypothetical protein n=1 Tax=Kitasatospora sp. NPDC059812 TaxID=3346958 RepID=UPI00364B57C3
MSDSSTAHARPAARTGARRAPAEGPPGALSGLNPLVQRLAEPSGPTITFVDFSWISLLTNQPRGLLT